MGKLELHDNELLNIIIKRQSREHMLNKGKSIILANRELLLEVEKLPDDEVLRYKIGDGYTPYSLLPYISSLYDCYPYIYLYNSTYTNGIKLTFNEG